MCLGIGRPNCRSVACSGLSGGGPAPLLDRRELRRHRKDLVIERSGIAKVGETRRATALDSVRGRIAGKANEGLAAHFCSSAISAVDIGEVALEPDVRLIARVVVIWNHVASRTGSVKFRV